MNFVLEVVGFGDVDMHNPLSVTVDPPLAVTLQTDLNLGVGVDPLNELHPSSSWKFEVITVGKDGPEVVNVNSLDLDGELKFTSEYDSILT
jgi:hypothetical protein